jgi:ribonuclease P protein component
LELRATIFTTIVYSFAFGESIHYKKFTDNTSCVFYCFNRTSIPLKFPFKTDEKLKSRKLIQQLFKEGKSFSHFPLRVLYIMPGSNRSHLQSAFSVSSKNFKRAVDRNRIKRLMREAYRLQKSTLQKELEDTRQYLAVFVIYTGNELPAYSNISERMSAVLHRLEKIIRPPSSV